MASKLLKNFNRNFKKSPNISSNICGALHQTPIWTQNVPIIVSSQIKQTKVHVIMLKKKNQITLTC